jgi:hypothetical protein
MSPYDQNSDGEQKYGKERFRRTGALQTLHRFTKKARNPTQEITDPFLSHLSAAASWKAL